MNVPVYAEDQGPVGQQILAVMQQTPTLKVEMKTSAADARKPVENGDRSAAVIIPAGLSDAVAQGKQADITVLTTPSNRDYRALAVRGIMGTIIQTFATGQIAGQVAVDAVKNSGATADPNAVARQASQQAIQLSQKPPLNLQTQVAKQNQSDNNYDQVVPGYALMFALFAVGAGAGTILDEKEAGTWKRLLVAPVSRWSLLGGKLGAQFVRALAQISLLFIVGKLFFHIDHRLRARDDPADHRHRLRDDRPRHAARLGRQDARPVAADHDADGADLLGARRFVVPALPDALVGAAGLAGHAHQLGDDAASTT